MAGASEHRRRKQRKERIEKEATDKEVAELKKGLKNSSIRRRKRRQNNKETEVVPDNEEPLPTELEEKPKKKRRESRGHRPTRRKVSKDRKDVEYPEKDGFPKGTLPKRLRKTLDDRFFYDLISVLEVNQALTIVRKDENTWTLGLGGAIITDTLIRLSGKAYMDEVLSHEYQAHMDEWGEYTEEEKIQVAQRAGTEWDEHDTPRINLMRCGDAYRKLLKIEKYKPKYRTLAARRAVRVKKD
jgi:hypothetical protein